MPELASAQFGQEFSSTELSCAGLKLESASGVPGGTKRRYQFWGSCRVYQSKHNGPEHAFPVLAEAVWDAKSRRLTEQLAILGDFEYYDYKVSGSVSSSYLCSADPIVGPAACNGDVHENKTGLEHFSHSFQSHKPLLAGRTTLAEATALNQDQLSGNPPPPPPAPVRSTPPLRAGLKPNAGVMAGDPPSLPKPSVDTADQSKAPRAAGRGSRTPARTPPPPPPARPRPRPGR